MSETNEVIEKPLITPMTDRLYNAIAEVLLQKYGVETIQEMIDGVALTPSDEAAAKILRALEVMIKEAN